MRSLPIVLLMSAAACAAAADLPITGREQLNATLWTQTADEYRMLATQVYSAATRALDDAAKANCAAWEQIKDASPTCNDRRLKPAVVLDVDETVLDNSPYQARLLRDGAEHNEGAWTRWVAERKAGAVPGALEFVKAAVAKKFDVFFVTNRSCETPPEPALADRYYDASGHALICPQKTATMETLKALGFPDVGVDHYLFANERAGWESRKEHRRRYIYEHFRVRIVMLIGDDLRDFVDRDIWRQNETALAPFVGRQWFVVPNAMYGSWETSAAGTGCRDARLVTPSEACSELRLEKKYEKLRDGRAVP